jgi:hypothetical protein
MRHCSCRHPAAVCAARFLRDGSRTEFVQNELGVLLMLPAEKRDPYDTVVELQVETGGVTPLKDQ